MHAVSWDWGLLMGVFVRHHRGGLEESLATEMEVHTARELQLYFNKINPTFKYVGEDGRFEVFRHTWYVVDQDKVLGMARTETKGDGVL